MPITHSWGVLQSCPGLSLADPLELAQTSGKGQADITTPPCLCQVVRPKETSVNLPVASSQGLLALLFGLWSKGLQPEQQVENRKLFLLPSTGACSFLHEADGPSSYVCPCDCMLAAFMMSRLGVQILHYYFQSPARCASAPLSKHVSLRVILFLRGTGAPL